MAQQDDTDQPTGVEPRSEEIGSGATSLPTEPGQAGAGPDAGAHAEHGNRAEADPHADAGPHAEAGAGESPEAEFAAFEAAMAEAENKPGGDHAAGSEAETKPADGETSEPASTDTSEDTGNPTDVHQSTYAVTGDGTGASSALEPGITPTADRPEDESVYPAPVAARTSAETAGSPGADNLSRAQSADSQTAGSKHREPVPPSAKASDEEARRRAADRDGALTGKPVMARVFQVLIAIFFPIMLLAAAIRAVTSPLFLWVEYHRPGFPADSFGFSSEDRMTYGSYTVDYILNWAPSRYLGELVNADGDQLFLDSEVGHMVDVKTVLVISFVVALAMLVFTIVACWHLARTYPGGVRRSLFAGAITTLILMVALTVTAILGWQTFFTQVHALFFADGTWTFRMDDTLIRLFPAQFWMDAAITVAALVVIVTVLTLILTWPTKARRSKSRLASEAARKRQMDSLAL